MKPSAIVTKAIDLIEEHGWGQGIYKDHSGRLCMIGALRAAAGEPLIDGGSGVPHPKNGDNYQAYQDAYWALVGKIPSRALPVVWNDQFAKSQDQVIDVLHRTAVALDEQGK